MPVRPRRQRTRRAEWSPRIALALTIGPRPTTWAPELCDAMLAAAWASFGPALIADAPAGSMPWGFWRFDPEVPDELRDHLPALHPVGDTDRVRAERDDLHRRRAAWLAKHRARWPTN